MEVNASSSNESLPFKTVGLECFVIRPGSFIFISFDATILVFYLPLCVLVLYLGVQRWQSSTSARTSHSDSFTYQMVVSELFAFLGCNVCVYAVYVMKERIFNVGMFIWGLAWYVQYCFHVLTCVERYLAVVHPVTYLSLKGKRGVRIRNICIGSAWLLCFAARNLYDDASFVVDLGLMIFSLMVVAFCSLSVLHVLIRPGPGEQGGDGKIVDQSKRRAFYTIVAILGVLSSRCLVNLFRAIYDILDQPDNCVWMAVELWLGLPCSLVLPLLFLHRAGRFTCSQSITK